jgi:hypothetical protein
VRPRPGKLFLFKTRVRYNWCQGPVPGVGLAVEKHYLRLLGKELVPNHLAKFAWVFAYSVCTSQEIRCTSVKKPNNAIWGSFLKITPKWYVGKYRLCMLKHIVTCQPFVGLRNWAWLGSRPVNNSSAQPWRRHTSRIKECRLCLRGCQETSRHPVRLQREWGTWRNNTVERPVRPLLGYR